QTGRHYIGFDTDADYIALGERRVADERQRLAGIASRLPAVDAATEPG
ncbi:MAG: hypothetical protein QOG97_3212, partial [Acidimicrobiaceae bacterium]|nr:hypothetical protein [Acidimicrobiaceae bacterium]